MSNPLPLNIAIATYGHTAALKKGQVPIAGVQPEFVEVKPIIAAFRRMVRDVEFDVCEMAPATYMIAREHGAPFKALPVFIFRRFHHAGLVYRSDAGIKGPKDLEGKRAGVRAYSVTTGLWTRGIMTNEYGVDNDKITWVVDDEEHVKTLQLPKNVQQAPEGKSLVELMATGDLSAAFTDNAGIGRAGAPAEGWKDGWSGAAQAKPTQYVEMFPNAEKLEAEWYGKTGIYPVHGLIVVKDELIAKHPWLGKALYDAFLASKEIYLKQLAAGESVSDKDAHYRTMSQIVGDPLPYGIDANRASIEAMMTYCYQQGLLKKQYAIDDMFIDPRA
jgi:4,5-dihydroxyphthalate decarboxylase